MKNRDRNNNQGIFYAVIGIATLVVTIIGATFAFFSASASSDAGAVNTGAATISLGFTDDDDGIKDSLVPIDETLPRFASVVGAATNDCKDDNGNNICSVYQFTISNPSTTASQRIYVTLTPTTNEFANLHYAVFKGNDTQIKAAQAQYDVDGTAAVLDTSVPANVNSNIIGANGDLVIRDTAFGANSTTAITLTPLEQVLAPSGDVTYTIVLWIHEISNDANPANGGDQTAVDSIITDSQTNETRGRQFAATINVTTAGGGSGVTGVLNTNSGGQGNS